MRGRTFFNIFYYRKFKNIFRLFPFRRGSFYRIERLRRNLGENKKGENNSLSVNKGIKKYEKRKLETKNRRKYKFFNVRNIVILIIILLTIIYINFSKYSIKSLYISVFIFIFLMLYLLVVERFKEKVEVQEEIKEIKKEREREHNVFLERVREIENIEKNQLENIILKNCDDYDIKVWKIGRATSLLIGKRTPRNRVDIDVSDAIYSNLVSRAHGMLNRVNGIWYYEDLGSQNGSGIEKKEDKRKIKLQKYKPTKVESGDIIYLANTKILLK